MASNSPVVISAAARGEQWAVKLKSTGWKSLSKAQKAAARAHGIGAVPVAVSIPRTPRLIAGNPTQSRRTKDQPGNAAKTMSIVKSEYLGEMAADGLVHRFVLDPRNVRTFPCISDNARSFNKYKFTDLKLRYSTKVQDSDCGITLAFSSDAGDPEPKGKFDMYSLSSKAEGVAHKNLLYSLPVDKSFRFLRDCPSENSKDVDAGCFYVLLDGKHDGRLGELFLDVSIVLSQPTYNQRNTQEIVSEKHIDGPNFCTVTKSANTYILEFLSAGNFLVSSYGSKLEKVGKKYLADAEQSQVDSATHSSNIVEARINNAGGKVIYYFASSESMSFRAYVSKL